MSGPCIDCKGSGRYEGLECAERCSRCGGSGEEPITVVGPTEFPKGITSVSVANQIMGKNIFGIQDAICKSMANPTHDQAEYLHRGVPISSDELEASKDTHILVADFGTSILSIRNRVRTMLFYEQDWYDNKSFAQLSGQIGWRLIRKIPVHESFKKTWDEQQVLLNEDEATPSAQVMVYTIIGHYLNTGERLFENVYARTSSMDSGGYRVGLGDFDEDGLCVSFYSDDSSFSHLGVASARKFPC